MELDKLIEQVTQEVLRDMNNNSNGIQKNSSSDIQVGNYDSSYAKYIDHTVLKADTTKDTIEKFCKEAKDYSFASVCVNPTHIRYAKQLLQGSNVKVATVIGFPLGANTSIVKAIETRDAIANGADEVDMVINIGAVKDGNFDLVYEDIKSVVDAANCQAKVKVIIETSLLTDEEKVKTCLLAEKAGADFVKTSTGFSTGGATVEDVELMRKTVGPKVEVKASTGIKGREDADKMIKAGATRFGTSSGIDIVEGRQPNKTNSNY